MQESIVLESSHGWARQPVRMLSEAMPFEGIDVNRFSRQVTLDPNFDPNGSLLAIAKASREPDAGFADRENGYRGYILAVARTVPLENGPDDSDAGYITLFGVQPKARRQGIGSALLQAAEEFLRTKSRSRCLVSPYAPGYFIPGVDVEAYSTGLDFLKRRGYEELYRPLAMERGLWDYNYPSQADEIIRSGRPKIHYDSGKYTTGNPLETMKLVNECFPGDWRRVVRECLQDVLNGDRPDRLHIAMDVSLTGAAKVVGFSHYKAERFGPIGVHPEYRGRGIGTVLTHLTLRSQQRAGYRSSWFLWTNDRTADRLYKPAGFREVRRFAVLKKEL